MTLIRRIITIITPPGMATIGAPVEEAVTLMAATIAKVPGEMSQK